jgi:hypothetical protein|tara:strand:- start:70 stop:333 length:264 start_codon:yes stop_codon:yes gene_type:complete
MMNRNDYEPGCYFDCSRGIHIGAEIQKLAETSGWESEEGIITDPDNEEYFEAAAKAEDWLNDFIIIEGHYWGYNECGDFGLWSMVIE